MHNKRGRNDPCPCGSGKKYKTCCFTSAEVLDFEWRKLRQLEGIVFDQHLIPYATQALPTDMLQCALFDCLPDDLPDIVDRELLFNNFFLPWFLFNWIPGDDFEVKGFNPEMTVAQNYINAHEAVLPSRERHFMEAMNQTYYSFYVILEVEINASLLVKDILLGSTHTIKERQGTHQLKQGDIVLSRILTMDHQSIFVGMVPFILPVGYHHDLLDFKEWLMEENDKHLLTPDILRHDFDLDLLDYFFDIMETAYNRPLPTLVNTDGELFQFSRSYFKLTLAPEAALQHLLPLALSNDPEEFLRDAKRISSGEVKGIELPWLKKGDAKHKSWNNTVLGHVLIKKDKLILETNSEKRTQKGKKLLTKYLGAAIAFQQTLIESPEQKMQSLRALNANEKSESERWMALPEVQEQLQAMAKSHWETWFNEPIPALNNQTPRQAAKTEKGRERLEALLLEYQRHDLEKGEHPFKADIPYLKAELALN